MSLPVILRPEAEEDLLTTRDWYNRQRMGLGEELAETAEQMFDQIAAMPEMYEVVLRDVRRGKLKRFPYVVY